MRTLAACVLAIFVCSLVLVVRAAAEESPPARPTVIDGRDAARWRELALQRDVTARRQARVIRILRAALRAETRRSARGLERGLHCIHRFEGSWNDPNAPYWGGLQMDMDFQRAYGGEFLRAFGTADRWPPAVQITVAMRAYLSGRGFGPWPNTRRMCGL